MLTTRFCHLSTLIPNDPITMKLRLMVKPGCWFHSAANHLFSPSAREKLIFFNPHCGFHNLKNVMWHGRQRKAFLFHPEISPKVGTYLLFPKVLILYVFSCNFCRFLVLFQFDTCAFADDVLERMVFMILTNDFASNISCYMYLSRLSCVLVKVGTFICWYGRWWREWSL